MIKAALIWLGTHLANLAEFFADAAEGVSSIASRMD